MRYEWASATERRTLPPSIAVSAVAFAIEPPSGARIGESGQSPATSAGTTLAGTTLAGTTLWIPLVRRTRAPYSGRWALPGGPTEWDETLTDTAMRTLMAAVLRAPGYLEQLYAFGAVERSAQAQRLVTIAYWAQYGEADLATPKTVETAPGETPSNTEAAVRGLWDDPPHAEPAGQTEQSRRAEATAHNAALDPNVAWFSADELPELAFDHAEIVEYALWRLRMKTEYSSVAHRFLGPEFTVAQLRRVHEAILGTQVDPANFRRQALASGDLSETGGMTEGSAHRPAKLYRFKGDAPSTPPR